MITIGIKFAVVVTVDGLHEEEFVDDISKYGEVIDAETENLDEDTPVKIFYIKSVFSNYVKFKLDYNCVEPREYVLFPMATIDDKFKVLEMLRG